VNKFKTLAMTSGIALLAASPLWSQGALVGTEALDDEITDIQDAIDDEIARGEDEARYGARQFAPGWTGSLSASVNATDGSTDTRDYVIAGRFRYGAGLWTHTFGFALEYAKADDVIDKNSLFAVYDANRDISDRFYVFGLASYEDDLLPSATFERDVFLGFGPGYRIVNTNDFAWRVQAGPGARYTVDNATDESTTEVSAIASSRLYYRLSDMVFLTNDTDAIYSEEAGTRAVNDFGVSFEMSDNLAARLGYRTEWTDVEGDETDNTINASLVLKF
jgi:putative salt-induced outer membrane protein